MKKHMLLMILLLPVWTVRADLVIDMETKNIASNKVSGSQVLMNSESLVILPSSHPQTRMLYKSSEDKFWQIDMKAGRAIPIDAQMGGQINAAMQQMQAQMAGMPPEQRAMMEQMMGNMMQQGQGNVAEKEKSAPQSVALVKTTEKKTVLGHPCIKYEAYAGTVKQSDLWVTDWSNLGIEAVDFQVFHKMAEFSRDLMDSLAQIPMVNADNFPRFPSLEDVDGFPVLVRTYVDGVFTDETIFKQVTKKDVEAIEFQVPEGFQIAEALA